MYLLLLYFPTAILTTNRSALFEVLQRTFHSIVRKRTELIIGGSVLIEIDIGRSVMVFKLTTEV